MIINPTAQQLMKKIPDRYELILTVAKRARELQGGAAKLTRFTHENYLTVAAHEINEGLVSPAKKRSIL